MEVRCKTCGYQWDECVCANGPMPGGSVNKCPSCGLDVNHCPCRDLVTTLVTRVVASGRPFLLGASISLVALTLVGCPHPDPLAPVQPPSGTPCQQFCAILERDKCPGWDGNGGQDEVRGTSDDVACQKVCSDFQSKGTYIADATCIEHATTCDAAEVCMFGP
jgi:hypothetical protein